MIDPLVPARAIHLAATVVAAGLTFFELAIAFPFLNRRTATIAAYVAALRWWIAAALAITAASGIAWALLVAVQVGDAPVVQVITNGTLATLLTDTRFGQVWLWRALLLTIFAVTLLSASKSIARVRLVAATLLLAALALVGHSAAAGWLQMCADMAHLLAAGLWLGGLPALAIMLASGISADVCANATRRFSLFGIGAVTALFLTGVFNTYLLMDNASALLETTYGQLVLLKIVLFGAMLAFAATNKWHWTPKLPARSAIAAIRRHSLIEAAIGLAILIVVGVLGTLPPPLHRHVHANGAGDESFVHIHDAMGMADVKIAGTGEVEIRLMQEDFTPLRADVVTIQFSQPGQSPGAASASPGADGLWRIPRVTLAPGVWTVAVTIKQAGNKPLVLDGPILIAPGSIAKSE